MNSATAAAAAAKRAKTFRFKSTVGANNGTTAPLTVSRVKGNGTRVIPRIPGATRMYGPYGIEGVHENAVVEGLWDARRRDVPANERRGFNRAQRVAMIRSRQSLKQTDENFNKAVHLNRVAQVAKVPNWNRKTRKHRSRRN